MKHVDVSELERRLITSGVTAKDREPMSKIKESEKLIGEIRSIQKELKTLEENLQSLAEVMVPEKVLTQKASKNKKSQKTKIPNPEIKMKTRIET